MTSPCPICGRFVDSRNQRGIHYDCRVRAQQRMNDLRREIIAAVTRPMDTKDGFAVRIVQPMPGCSWDRAFARVYPTLAAGWRRAR